MQSGLEPLTLSINTSAVRQDGQKWLSGKVFADWPTSQMRDAVVELVLQPFGKAKINSSQKLQHSRVLELLFSTGEVLGLRLDQGVSYWRVSSWSKGGASGTWFNFANLNAAVQAKAIAEMEVWVEGQIAPTQVFVKLRNERWSRRRVTCDCFLAHLGMGFGSVGLLAAMSMMLPKL